jgi:hypothetical protein
MQSLVKTERFTDPDQTNAGRAAEVRKHLPDELMQFGVVYHLSPPGMIRCRWSPGSDSLSPGWSQVFKPI